MSDEEQTYRVLFESNPVPMWVYDVQSLAFLAVNDAAVDAYGYSRDEFLAMTIKDIRPSTDVERLVNILSSRVPGMDYAGGWKHQKKDGSTIDVEIVSHGIRFDGHEAELVLATNVTDRVLAQQERHASEEKYRALFEESKDTVFISAPDGTLLDINPAGVELFGYASKEEFLKIDIAHDLFCRPEDRKTYIEVLQRQGFIKDYELTYRRKDGKVLTVLETSTVIRDAQGKIVGYRGINRDVTERRTLMAQLLRTQRLESIGTLAGGIAHDLNNVLAPILLSIEILGNQNKDARSQILLDTIATSAKRGADIIRQILTFSRGADGEKSVLAPKHLVLEMQNILKETFPKNIRVEVDSLVKDGWTIEADPTQIHQVLLNLCVNARDAMPQGGKLKISMDNVNLDANYARMNIDAKAGPYVVLGIMDTGSGIPQDIREKIFEPFFTTKEIGKGTGLGLSIVAGIVKNHGGFINVYSEMGKGTEFKIYLPAVASSAAQEPVVPQAVLPMGHGELILVVDDEASIREITSATLEIYGYRVLCAADGVEALTLFTERRAEISVVITDMTMPVLDGAATIKVLERMQPTVKVILTSGNFEHKLDADSLGPTVKVFLQKPYTAEKLLLTLHDILGST